MVAEEVKEPERNIPLALVGGLIVIAVLYMLVNAAVQYALPPALVGTSPSPMSDAVKASFLGGAAAVETVKVDEALAPGEIVVGLKAQVRPAGAEQLREICPLNPPTDAALILRLAEPPCVTVALCAERLSEKSGAPTAAAIAPSLASVSASCTTP